MAREKEERGCDEGEVKEREKFERVGEEREEAISEIVKKVCGCLSVGDLFPPIEIEEVLENSTSISDIMKEPSIVTLLKIFSDADLSPTLGYNAGSHSLTLLLSIPMSTPPLSLSRAMDDRGLFVWVMLHLFADCQREIETEYAKSAATPSSSPSLSTSSSSPSPSPVLLANRCLHHFFSLSGVCILRRHLSHSHNRLTLSLDTCTLGMKTKDGTLVSDRRQPLFAYIPSYVYLSSYDPASLK